MEEKRILKTNQKHSYKSQYIRGLNWEMIGVYTRFEDLKGLVL